MSNRGQTILGGAVILLGLIFLLAEVFAINIWAICFPIGLISIGLWVLFRPQLMPSGSDFKIIPIGNIHRSGEWQVADEEILTFVGEMKLDLTMAEIPTGETKIRVIGFVNEIDLLAPESVGVSVSSTAFLNQVRLWGKKHETFVIPINQTSDGYDFAEKKIRLEIISFVAELKVDQT